jgi:hypothetical protein
MTVKELKKAAIKTTGTYVERASVLALELEKALGEELGINVLYEKRGDDPKQPCYLWELRDSVAVGISKSDSADPRVYVYRSDPVRQPPGETDGGNGFFERNYDDKLYHVGKIAIYVREQMEYNRKKLAEHQANQAVVGRDLTGVMVPKSVSIERNPKTGFYELSMVVRIKELGGEEIKIAVAACRDFKKAVEPFEKKEAPDA